MDKFESKYLGTFDEFLEANDNIEDEWKDLLAPHIDEEETNLFAFVLSYIFM